MENRPQRLTMGIIYERIGCYRNKRARRKLDVAEARWEGGRVRQEEKVGFSRRTSESGSTS
jgi:hypothetical protein